MSKQPDGRTAGKNQPACSTSDGLNLLASAALVLRPGAGDRIPPVTVLGKRPIASAGPASDSKRHCVTTTVNSTSGLSNKENSSLGKSFSAMDLSKTSTQTFTNTRTSVSNLSREAVHAALPSSSITTPSSNFNIAERLSAFTPTSGHKMVLPQTSLPDPVSLRFLPGLSDLHRPPAPEAAAAYNVLATANIIAALAANGHPGATSYLYGAGALTSPLARGIIPGPTIPHTSAYSPSISNPVLKELISVSGIGSNAEHRRQSPDTTTDSSAETASTPIDRAPTSLAIAATRNSTPGIPAAVITPGFLPKPGADAGIPAAHAQTLKECLSQLTVQVPMGAHIPSGPTSQSPAISIGGQSGLHAKDGRYLERRRRNNEAAKRCRANRRALFEYRFKRSQELEHENVDLKNQMASLRHELSRLEELCRDRGIIPKVKINTDLPRSQAKLSDNASIIAEIVENRESGHESDFSSHGDEKKCDSVGWSSSSPESGVSSPPDSHALVAGINEDATK